MIDFNNEIFSTVAADVRDRFPEAKITGEYTRSPATFPMVTLDETQNVTVDSLMDSSHAENFAGLQYRLQVFSNKQSGKKAEARAIFAVADEVMRGMGFRRTSYSTTPEIYDSTIYCITANYEGVVSAQGYMYKR